MKPAFTAGKLSVNKSLNANTVAAIKQRASNVRVAAGMNGKTTPSGKMKLSDLMASANAINAAGKGTLMASANAINAAGKGTAGGRRRISKRKTAKRRHARNLRRASRRNK
jgi:hypothetical protein